MSDPIVIRAASAAEFAAAVDWAADEGWNPGLDDLAAFHAADPDGFLMAFENNAPIGSISVVRYGADFGFLGFYIIRPEHRGRGIGLRLWNAGLEHLKRRVVGLDGVVAQQGNYRKSGFTLAGRNVRYQGRPNRAAAPSAGVVVDSAFEPIADQALAFDRRCFPAPRDDFMRSWIAGAPRSRQARFAIRDSALAGFGVIRACRSGYKIGPLFAADRKVADALFQALVETVEADAEIVLDVPEDNAGAVSLALDAGLAPSFETARMYLGAAPALPLERIFGVTTFELG